MINYGKLNLFIFIYLFGIYKDFQVNIFDNFYIRNKSEYPYFLFNYKNNMIIVNESDKNAFERT